MKPEMSVFKKSFPLTFTSFVNKSCQIGMSLLPMILVDRRVGTLQSSLLMGVVKGSTLAGPWASGRACDRWGMKAVLLAAFALSALGLSGMAFSHWIPLLALSAIVAQLGDSAFSPPARILLTRLVSPSERQESIGWLRTANNLGQIFSYTLGALLSGLGIPLLVFMDGLSSLFAFCLGFKILPRSQNKKNAQAEATPKENPTAQVTDRQKRLLWLATLLITGFSFIYELYMTGSAALFRMHFGAAGLRVFSIAMVVNTVLCTIFAVIASRFLKNPNFCLPVGLILTALGAAVATEFHEHLYAILGGMFILTVGEILYGALGQYVLIQMAPAGARQGAFYGTSVMIQASGKIFGSALAFPLVVKGVHPGFSFLFSALPFLGIWWVIRKDLTRVMAS